MKPYYADAHVTLHHGDALSLRTRFAQPALDFGEGA